MTAATLAHAPFAGVSLAPGAVLWDRLRLEKPLAFRGDCWLATDLRTGAKHAVELLRLQAHPSLRDATKLSAAFETAAALAHPHLLAPYRLEGDWPELGVVTPAPAVLAESFRPAAELLRGDLRRMLAWFVALADAVRAIHAAGPSAHGAITPPRVLTDAATLLPLLTGFPHAACCDREPDAAFLSPARRQGAAPTAADDIFSLGALAYQLFTDSAPPPAATETTPPAIDEARAARNLPAAGFAPGWDEPIRRALSADPAARPSSVDDLLDALREKTGEPSSADAARAGTSRPRRPSIWRNRRPTGTTSPSSEIAESPIFTLEKIRAERAELLRLRAELARRQETTAQAVAAAEAKQNELRQLAERLQRESTELAGAQQKLQAGEQTLAQARSHFDREKRELEQRLAALTAAQDSLRQDKEKLRTHESQLGAREREVREVERTLNEVSGGAGAKHWRTYAQQLAAEKSDAERQLQELAASRRDALAAAAAVSAAAPVSEPPPPAAGTPPPRESPPPLTAPPPPPAAEVPPPAPEVRKASLVVGNRRLHVFAGPLVRFGRRSDSDVLLVAVSSGSAQLSLSVNREISRKHFELRVEGDSLRVVDGWSDDGKPSQHGLCVDGRRVGPAGAALKTNALLSLTTRAPGGSVPHWRATLLTRPERTPDGGSRAALTAAFLQRLDHAPDDVLIVLDRAALKDLGLSESVYRDAAIVRRAGEFAWQLEGQLTPFAQGASPFPSITVFSLGAAPSGPVPET